MKGYKGTDANMCCLGFQYELGKRYKAKGKLRLYQNGFHFCEKLIAIDSYYDLSTSRVFEVEATGDIQERQLKFCTNEIKFIRELSKEEIIKLANEAVNDVDVYIHEILAKSKLALPETLEILSKEPSDNTRGLVAGNSNTNKETLKLLSHDECCFIRSRVASNPNASEKVLEYLSQDEDWFLRQTVASNPNTSEKVLEKLSRDENHGVRSAVAGNPNINIEILNMLSKNKEASIRCSIANTKTLKTIRKNEIN